MSIEYSLAWQEVFNCIKLISAEDFWQQCALICNDKFRITSNQNLVSWIKYRSRYLAFAIVPKQAVYTRIATILQNNLTLIFINIQINYNLKNFVLINI